MAADCNVYFLRAYSGGAVLWNASEAYLFIGVARQGHRVNCLRYPWFLVKGYLGAVEEPDDDHTSVVVIRETSSGVERHVLKLGKKPDGGPTQITPIEGRLYGNWPELGGLCRWSGDHFERATEDEQRRLDGTNLLTTGDIDNSQSGWSRRGFGTGRAYNFSIDVGDKFGLSVKNVPTTGTVTGTISIDLLRHGRDPKNIWNLDGSPRGVSPTQYEQAFQKRE